MTAPNQDLIEKLQKILALADPTRNPSQAQVEAAMAKAQELAIRHNIDLASINVDGEVSAPKMETDANTVQLGSKYEQPYHQSIFHVLQECFDVRIIIAGTHWNHNAQKVIGKVWIIGEKLDVAMATYCWSWLEQLFPRCYREWRKREGAKDGWVTQRSFYRGLGQGIRHSNRRQKESLSKDDANKYALVIVDKEALVKAKVDDMFGGTLKEGRKTHAQMDWNAMEGGEGGGQQDQTQRGPHRRTQPQQTALSHNFTLDTSKCCINRFHPYGITARPGYD